LQSNKRCWVLVVIGYGSTDQIFQTWTQFTARFLNDFPCFSNPADVRLKMSKTHRDSTESPSDYFYKMLAFSKKGELPDSAIRTHIINGINDYDLKRKVSNSFVLCNALVRDILAYSAHNVIKHNASQMSNKRDLNVSLHKPNSFLFTKRPFNDTVEVTVKC